MTDQEIEMEIQAKGLTAAPRVTPADVEANIASEFYFTAAEGVAGREVAPLTGEVAVPKSLHLLTFCVLVLKNGFTVTGENACVSPENFDPELGRKQARQKAINKVWELMGYALKERLAATSSEVTIGINHSSDADVEQGFSDQPEADAVTKELIRAAVAHITTPEVLLKFQDDKGVVVGTMKFTRTPEGETWEWEGDKDKCVLLLTRDFFASSRLG